MEHRTFSGRHATDKHQPVLYITERSVFRLSDQGIMLTEIAPGIDLQTQVLDQMDFTPAIAEPPTIMDPRIFTDSLMGLQRQWNNRPLNERSHYDDKENRFYVDFGNLSLTATEQIDAICRAVVDTLSSLNQKVDAIVNYDRFQIDPELVNDYAAMVADLEQQFYSSVTRYNSSLFLRLKLDRFGA